MDPDDLMPAGVVAHEGRPRRKVAALETRQIVSELLFELKEVGEALSIQLNFDPSFHVSK